MPFKEKALLVLQFATSRQDPNYRLGKTKVIIMAPAELAPVLHTPRLTLTHFSWSIPEDAAIVISSMSDPVSIEKQGDLHMHTPQDIRRWELGTHLSDTTLAAAYKKAGRPIPADGLSAPSLPWYVAHLGADNPSGERIGIITMMECQPPVPHIGWAFLSRHHGKGYATEAARELLRYFRDDFGIDGVLAITDPDNRGSYHVAEKLGMVPNPHRLRWRSGAADRKIGDGSEPDVLVRCYLTPDTPSFPEGTEFQLFWDGVKMQAD